MKISCVTMMMIMFMIRRIKMSFMHENCQASKYFHNFHPIKDRHKM